MVDLFYIFNVHEWIEDTVFNFQVDEVLEQCFYVSDKGSKVVTISAVRITEIR